MIRNAAELLLELLFKHGYLRIIEIEIIQSLNIEMLLAIMVKQASYFRNENSTEEDE